MIKEVQRHIDRALQGIRLAFRGKLTGTDSAGKIQLSQVSGMAGELLQSVELMQHYGYTSHPPAGTECIVLPLGGRNGHGIIIATENGALRVASLASGETAIYNQWGDSILLRTDRRMQIVSSLAVDITSPTVNMSGDLNVQGSIVAQGNISDHGNKSMLGMRNVYNVHTHADPQGGSVAAPGSSM